jgi:hypothetical protein
VSDDQPDDAGEEEVPEGAATFPLIPEELGVDPLLLAVLHATVFLLGSAETVVNPAAADLMVERLSEYLQRLEGAGLRRAQEDMQCLVTFARQQKWPRGEVQTLKTFLADMGAEESDEEGEE